MVADGQAATVLLIVVCAPVVGGLAACWYARLAIVGGICAWVGCVLLFHRALVGHETAVFLGDWLQVASLTVGLDFRIDLLSAILLLAMHSLGLAAQLLAVDYLRDGVARSLRLSSLLQIGYGLLCCGDNYILLFVGWALVGVGAHLLTGVDYSESMGDVRVWMALHSGDWVLMAGLAGLCAVGQVGWSGDAGEGQWIGLCLILAAAVRSAQLPFHFWLTKMGDPWAMLQGYCVAIAGIYLLLRTRGIWSADPLLVYAAVACGVVTALACAVASLCSRDVRLALAYAICSQLGIVLAALACGDGDGAALHIAVFGLGMGLCLIGITYLAQAEGEIWDVRTVGRWRRILPLPFWAVVLGVLTISGVPPLAGCWSYAVLLGGLADKDSALWVGGCLLVFVAALCALRLLFLLLTAEDGEKPQAFTAPGNAVQTALWSLTILVLSAAALGYPPGAGSFSATDGGLHWDLLFGPGMAGLIGLLVAWLVYGEQSVGAEHKTGALDKFCARGFYAEDLGHNLVGRPLLRFAGWARDLDTFLFELVVIELSALGLRGFGWILGRLQSGQVRFYVAMILLAVLAALCYLTLTWS